MLGIAPSSLSNVEKLPGDGFVSSYYGGSNRSDDRSDSGWGSWGGVVPERAAVRDTLPDQPMAPDRSSVPRAETERSGKGGEPNEPQRHLETPKLGAEPNPHATVPADPQDFCDLTAADDTNEQLKDEDDWGEPATCSGKHPEPTTSSRDPHWHIINQAYVDAMYKAGLSKHVMSPLPPSKDVIEACPDHIRERNAPYILV